MKFIRDEKKLEGKTVIVRSDFDVPRNGEILFNNFRIRMSIPTIEFLHSCGAKVIVISKMGRPKGWDESQTLHPAAKFVAEKMDFKFVETSEKLPDYPLPHIVFFKGDIRDEKIRENIKAGLAKDIIILENIRFYPEESSLDENFAKSIASLGDYYVNDAFAVDHRKETSVSVLPKYMESYCGLNLQKEIEAMDKVLKMHRKPFTLILGGIKISDKVSAMRNLGSKADNILVGGALANLFFLAKGLEIGKSKVETDKLEIAKEILRNYKDKLVLPKDVVVSKEDFSGVRVCAPTEVKKDEAIYDIGPATILAFSHYIKSAKKMVWNGPLGMSKIPAFSNGTMSTALLFASKCDEETYGLVGGGDSQEAVEKAKVIDQISFVSTGGGAMLEYLGGEKLPGIEALK